MCALFIAHFNYKRLFYTGIYIVKPDVKTVIAYSHMISAKINKLDKNCIIIMAGSQMTSVDILFCTGAYLISHCAIETTRERT